MDKNWLLVLQQAQVGKLLETNQVTQRFGLSLTESDVRLIAEAGKDTLKEARRVELGDGITPKIIFEFCDSAYLNQSNYRDTIIRLQEIFFLYKNEMQDEITDDELLHFMKARVAIMVTTPVKSWVKPSSRPSESWSVSAMMRLTISPEECASR